MIASPKPAKSTAAFSRRNLLIGILVIALVFLAVRLIHGKGAKTAAHPLAAAACLVKHTGRHATPCASRPPVAAKRLPGRHGKPRQGTPAHRHIAPVVHLTALQLYARHLLPALVHSTPQFAAADLAVQNTLTDSLSNTCSWYGAKIQALTDQVDGVPHPGQWYAAVSSLHFKVLGVFHNMSGALLACVTAADNLDEGGIATARGDLTSAVDQLQQIRDYTWWLGYRHK